MDKILDLVNINSLVAILVFVVIQIWIQKSTIKNKNIVISRLNWLKELKKNFVEYNTVLEKLIEFDNQVDTGSDPDRKDNNASTPSLKTLYPALKNKKIDLTMQFKAYETEENDKFQNAIMSSLMDIEQDKSDIKLNLDDCLEKPDDCERQFLKLTDIIDEFYSKRRNAINNASIIDNETLLKLVQQFEICICKNEWTKINFESNIFFAHIAFTKKEQRSLKILKSNLETIINAALTTWNDDSVKNKSTKKLSKSEISKRYEKYGKYADNIEKIWENPKHNTVGDKLESIITEVATEKGEDFPKSMMTSSGKRYIYSIDAPVHPNGKDFFNPKKFKVDKIKQEIYLETNFSNNQAKSLAKQIMEVNDYTGKENK